MPSVPGPYLTKFIHKQEGLSGAADDFTPPTSGFNSLIDDIPKQLLIGLRPEGQDLTVTATAYPGTPDMRFPLTPWTGKYLVVMSQMERTAGSGTFRLKVEVEAPTSTLNTAFIMTTSSSGVQSQIANIDISTLGGSDRRGMDGWLNIYMEVSDGSTTGVLRSMMAMQAEDVTGNTYLLW